MLRHFRRFLWSVWSLIRSSRGCASQPLGFQTHPAWVASFHSLKATRLGPLHLGPAQFHFTSPAIHVLTSRVLFSPGRRQLQPGYRIPCHHLAGIRHSRLSEAILGSLASLQTTTRLCVSAARGPNLWRRWPPPDFSRLPFGPPGLSWAFFRMKFWRNVFWVGVVK